MYNEDKTLSSINQERRNYWNTNLLPRIKGYDYQEDKKKYFYLLPNPVMVPSEINFSLSPLN